jgi:hypothetical protein
MFQGTHDQESPGQRTLGRYVEEEESKYTTWEQDGWRVDEWRRELNKWAMRMAHVIRRWEGMGATILSLNQTSMAVIVNGKNSAVDAQSPPPTLEEFGFRRRIK